MTVPMHADEGDIYTVRKPTLGAGYMVTYVSFLRLEFMTESIWHYLSHFTSRPLLLECFSSESYVSSMSGHKSFGSRFSPFCLHSSHKALDRFDVYKALFT